MSLYHLKYAREIVYARGYVLERDGYKCQQCGSRHRLEVHHVKPLSKGGSPHPDNCKTLCRNCHISLHASPLAAAKREWLEYSSGI